MTALINRNKMGILAVGISLLTLTTLVFGLGKDTYVAGHSSISRKEVEVLVADARKDAKADLAKSDEGTARIAVVQAERLSRVEDKIDKIYDILLRQERRSSR